jgi:hypothetical protein
MQRHNLKKFRTIELVVNGIFRRSKKNFILHITKTLCLMMCKLRVFFRKFYLQYVEIVNLYNTKKPTIMVIKSIENTTFGK